MSQDPTYKLPFFINPIKLDNDNFISYSYQKKITYNNISIRIPVINSGKPKIIISLKFFKKIVDNRNYIIERDSLNNNSIEEIANNCLNSDESIIIDKDENENYFYFKKITFDKLHIKSNKLEYIKNDTNLSLKLTLLVSLIYKRNFENVNYILENDDIERWRNEPNDSYIPTFVINKLNQITNLVRNL